MEKLEKDLVSYAKDSEEMKNLEKDMKQGAKKTEKDLEKYAKEIEKDQERDSIMGFRHPSDISFTGTDGYTYIQADYHQLNPMKVQKMLDKQRSHPPGTLSSYTTRNKK